MSNLICPFCQQELKEIYCNGIYVGLACKNVGCLETKSTLGNKAIWQELTRTREALEIAVDALKEQQRWLGVIRISMVSHLNDEKGTVFQPYDADPTVLNIGKAKVLLNNALEQIIALEQKE